MYILYLDESGAHAEAKYFVLAGLAAFEREIHWFAEDLEAIQERYFPNRSEPVHFHASALRAPDGKVKPPFDELSSEARRQIIADILKIIQNRRGVLFAAAIEKARLATEDPYERAFEDLTSRFDLFLRRYNAREKDEQRGMIVVAESSYRDRLEALGRKFRGGATRWGQIHAIADVPFFVPSENTRILQLADFCANAVYGRYNHGITRDFDVIAPRFDTDDGCIHGLVHISRLRECTCPACLSRHIRTSSGTG
jgi:hypothetical protein